MSAPLQRLRVRLALWLLEGLPVAVPASLTGQPIRTTAPAPTPHQGNAEWIVFNEGATVVFFEQDSIRSACLKYRGRVISLDARAQRRIMEAADQPILGDL